jgi:serine/threonine-protein kinase
MDTLVREGEILAGKYRVDRVLGVGGMGVVVAAHHLELDDRVAVKFLLPETLGNPDAVARFAREARAAVKIKSEHVARVSDVGRLESGAPYMVMEYLEGSDLSGWLTERGPLPTEQAVEFALQASEAIAEAHSLGIVHRDLKPANLFVIRRPDGGLSIKVLDFGISKMKSLTGSGGEGSMTRTSTMLGSPIYMSPEQIQSSKDVDARGDIWALGVILYELIMGEPPFGGAHMAELIYAIISSVPAPMRARRPDVPEGLERVILHCLSKNRAERFASIAELSVALLPFAPPRSLASVERISGVTTGNARAPQPAANAFAPPAAPQLPASAVSVSGGTHAAWGNTAVEKKRSRWFVGGAATAAAALMLGLLIVAKGLLAAGPSASAAAPLGSAHTLGSASPNVAQAEPLKAETPQAESPKTEPSKTAETSLPSVPALPASAPAASASARSRPFVSNRPRSTPPVSPPVSRDPWGGSQH